MLGYQNLLFVLWISRFPEIEVVERPRRQFLNRFDQIDVLWSNISRYPLFEKRYQQLEISGGKPFKQLETRPPAGAGRPRLGLLPVPGGRTFAPPLDIRKVIQLL